MAPRYALVIGISKFPHLGNLPNAVTDAEAIAQLLEQDSEYAEVQRYPCRHIEAEKRYEVKSATVSAENLWKRISDFLALLSKKKADGLLFIASHGLSVKSFTGEAEGFIAASKNDGGSSEAIPFRALNQAFSNSCQRSLTVLLDCCHSGLALEQIITGDNLKREFSSSERFAMLAACRSDQMAYEAGDHSEFTEAVLQACREENVNQSNKITFNRLSELVKEHLKLKRCGQISEDLAISGSDIEILRYPQKLLATNILDSELLEGEQQIIRKSSEYDLTAYAGNNFSVHLVIAIYLVGKQKDKKIRLEPKVSYRNSENNEIETISSESIQPSICELEDVPQVIEKMSDAALEIIKKHNDLNECLNNQKLVIGIFLPLELLCLPLVLICGKNKLGSLLSLKPIFFGCSDRFKPGFEKSETYQQQLNSGWSRFLENIPNLKTSPLSELKWLQSDRASDESFSDYSAFQCYGDWLGENEEYLDEWMELILSGIPLALWISGSQVPREEIEKTFYELTDYSLVDFIGRIPITRARQRKKYKSDPRCLGVFFEDPNFFPDTPQNFEWAS